MNENELNMIIGMKEDVASIKTLEITSIPFIFLYNQIKGAENIEDYKQYSRFFL